jgi:Methylamine utilisation protein MauE
MEQGESSSRPDPKGELIGAARDTSKVIPRGIDAGVSFLIGVIFIVSGADHLLNPYYFLGSIYAYGICAPRTGQVVAVILPALQLVVGASLLVRLWRDAAHFLALSMLLAFAFAQGVAFVRGLDISCGCFAACEETPIGLSTVLPLLGLILASVLRASLRLTGAI